MNRDMRGRMMSASGRPMASGKSRVFRRRGQAIHYDGSVDEDGEPHGFGKETNLSNGTVYEGQWIHGKFTGEGRYIDPSSHSYEGQWLNREAHGTGVMTYKNGDKYKGHWKKGKMHGDSGTFTFANGDKYNGSYKANDMDGHGTYTYADGSSYVGQFKKNKMHGEGVAVFVDGGRYTGSFKNDKYCGRGTLEYSNGDVYTGKFYKNLPHGHGHKRFKDGEAHDTYIGEWRKGKPHGKGKKKYGNGETFEGVFKNGKEVRGTFIFSDGEKYAGDFLNGKSHGHGEFTFGDGSAYKGQWKEDRKHGRGTLVEANGNIFEGLWADGKKHGVGLQKCSQGSVVYEEEYDNGKLVRRKLICGEEGIRTMDGLEAAEHHPVEHATRLALSAKTNNNKPPATLSTDRLDPSLGKTPSEDTHVVSNGSINIPSKTRTEGAVSSTQLVSPTATGRKLSLRCSDGSVNAGLANVPSDSTPFAGEASGCKIHDSSSKSSKGAKFGLKQSNTPTQTMSRTKQKRSEGKLSFSDDNAGISSHALPCPITSTNESRPGPLVTPSAKHNGPASKRLRTNCSDSDFEATDVSSCSTLASGRKATGNDNFTHVIQTKGKDASSEMLRTQYNYMTTLTNKSLSKPSPANGSVLANTAEMSGNHQINRPMQVEALTDPPNSALLEQAVPTLDGPPLGGVAIPTRTHGSGINLSTQPCEATMADEPPTNHSSPNEVAFCLGTAEGDSLEAVSRSEKAEAVGNRSAMRVESDPDDCEMECPRKDAAAVLSDLASRIDSLKRALEEERRMRVEQGRRIETLEQTLSDERHQREESQKRRIQFLERALIDEKRPYGGS